MPEHIVGPDIMGVWTEQDGNTGLLRTRIEEVRNLLAGRLKAPLDESVMPGHTDRESLRISTPHPYTMALKTLNMLISQPIRALREQSASGIAAEQHASQIEKMADAGMHNLYPRDAVLDNLLNEGECGVKVICDRSHWAGLPVLHEGGDPDKPMKGTYQLDSKGRKESDGYYSEPGTRRKYTTDSKQSISYFEQRKADYKARHIPVVMEAISRRNGIPINIRRMGNRHVMDGYIEKRTFLASTLLEKGYVWGESPLLSETDSLNAQHELYQYWGKKTNGDVYVSRSIDGLRTSNSKDADQTGDAVINLTKLYGLQDIPIAYDYGWNFPGCTNPQDKGVPLLSPYGRSIMSRNALLTMLMVRAWRATSLFLMYKPDAELLKVLGKTGLVDMPNLEAGKITPVLGDIMGFPDMDLPEVGHILALLSNELEAEEPSHDATGGNEHLTGRARDVARHDVLGAFEQVQQADKRLYSQAAGMWLEQACAIGEKHGNVWVFVSENMPQSATGRTSRAKLEIDPGMFDGDFDISAEYPQEIGANMALTQQLMEAHQKGEIPHEVVLEKGFGFADPAGIIAKNEAEKARNTPLGQARLMQWASTIAGDEEQAAIMQAIAEGELMKLMPQGPNQASNTLPMGAATAGVPPPNMTGISGINPAQQSLAGQVGGGMQVGPENQAGIDQNAA